MVSASFSSSSTQPKGKSVPGEPLKKRKRDDDDANTRSNLQSQAACDQTEHQIDTEEEEEQAPYVILVQGPPNVGKSLLIKSIVKFYTKRNLSDIRGPITIIAGKKRRLQFVECPNDVCGMIDASKYADVVLLLIDASYGFEMETFEFHTLLQVHGAPKVMGVLTHLDKFEDKDKMSETKQRLRLQFWTEIYDGAELFYLSGLDRGMYRKSQIHELARFISDMKLHPLSWRAAHPYLLVDHFEDITPPERLHMDRKCDRKISLAGYLRGCNIKKGTKVHIAGVGDFPMAGITKLADPCPLPSTAKMKGLNVKKLFCYALMPALTDLLWDKCLDQIDTPDESVQFSNVDEIGKGTYVMLEVCDVPFEMVETFDPCHPILVGGISLEEENVGYMQARIKQHSWHTKSLKTRDSITISIGWRRYQTTPVFATEETRRSGSHEMLHCTPENTYCFAMFWGPLAFPNTGFVVVQNVTDNKAAFQIAATGVILGLNQAEKIVMECKRKGTLYKIINGNTALIMDMFKSDLDVTRHKNVVINTSSGVRGSVVEAARKKLVYKLMRKGDQPREGIARCAFYREVISSDEFFRVVWKPVQVPRCFNPFTASQFRDSLDKDDPTRRRQALGQRRAVVCSEGESRTSEQLRKEYKIIKKRQVMEKKKSQMLVLPQGKKRFKKRVKFY
ncbi:hypothetical protein MKW92_042185 [Papaver armeniacum]|nr:hypothetical protein MKW92_042185 [Papaver armeniacum]